jgi:hypothetical protein
MDGSDAAKLQVYFNDLSTNDPLFAKLKPTGVNLGIVSIPTGGTSYANFLGQITDFTALLAIPGGSLGKIGKTAAKGIITSSRFVANTSKLVIPALLNMSIGAVANVARDNAIAALQQNPDLYTNTLKKVSETAGQGAAANFLFALGFQVGAEYVLPAAGALLRGPVKTNPLAPTGHLFWRKPADMATIDATIAKAGGVNAVPDSMLQSLTPFVKDTAWLRNARMVAIAKDASTHDLRPLDQLAVASSDMPDVIFAPKDWSKPLNSGFTIWETKAERTNKSLHYLNIGEATSLGELRSKLSDMFASRFDSIDDSSKPLSMQSSKAFVIQGKLQALNAKAYDPFPETVEKGFVRPNLRGYLSPTEAQDAAYAAIANGGQAYHVHVDATTEMMKRIADNKSFLTDESPITLTSVSPEDTNAIAILTKPAPMEADRKSVV